MGLEEVVNLSIDTVSSPPSQASFGVMLIMTYHSVVSDMLLPVSYLTDLTDAGFSVTSPTYRAVQAAFRPPTRPPQVIIGKRTRAYTQVLHFTPIKTTEGFHYIFECVSPGGVVTSINYVVLAGATVNTICVALAALIDPMTDVTAVVAPDAPNATHIVITTAVGKLSNFRQLPIPSVMQVADVSADPGIASDLADIEALDDTSWYGIGFDHSPETVINAAAAWVETRRKVAFCNTSDSLCLAPGTTTDIASDLKAAAYMRTELLFSAKEILSYSAIQWLATILPKDPGSYTLAFKTLPGITADKLSTAEKTAAKNKRLNTYTILGANGVTQWGQNPDGGYTDIVIGTDWLFARQQEAVFAAFTAADRIPYTDSGVDTVRNVINGTLVLGQKKAFLAEDPPFTITAPKVADIPLADRANRHLPDVKWTATVQGAVHTVDIGGTLSV